MVSLLKCIRLAGHPPSRADGAAGGFPPMV